MGCRVNDFITQTVEQISQPPLIKIAGDAKTPFGQIDPTIRINLEPIRATSAHLRGGTVTSRRPKI